MNLLLTIKWGPEGPNRWTVWDRLREDSGPLDRKEVPVDFTSVGIFSKNTATVLVA